MERSPTEMHDLKTGLPEVDVEHQLQFRLVEALRRAVLGGQDRAALAALLRQLLDASNVHFLSEELLMRLHAWERYEQHTEEHRRLLEDLDALKLLFEKGSDEALEVALDQLQVWLGSHIRGMDRAFTDYVARGGLAAPAAPAR